MVWSDIACLVGAGAAAWLCLLPAAWLVLAACCLVGAGAAGSWSKCLSLLSAYRCSLSLLSAYRCSLVVVDVVVAMNCEVEVATTLRVVALVKYEEPWPMYEEPWLRGALADFSQRRCVWLRS